MCKTLLLSAAFLGLTAGAFAQTGSAPPTTDPAAVPEMTAPGVRQSPMSHGMADTGRPASDSDIRPGHVPGVDDSFPASNKASNLAPGDTRSVIAPRLPAPAGGPDASPAAFLTDAQRALATRQTGRAQEALERAETAMLQRSVPAGEASTPDQSPGVLQIRSARDALARGDIAGAQKAIAGALPPG